MPGTVSEVSATLVAKNHPAPAARGEDPRLLLRRLPGEQRQHFGAGGVMGLSQRLGRLADLALAGQKHQHVAGAATLRLVHRVDQCIVEIGGLLLRILARRFRHRQIADLDRIEPAGDLDDRCRLPTRSAKVPGEAFGIERRRGDDHLRSGRFGNNWRR